MKKVSSSLELHKRINARLYARQCWPTNIPIVKLSHVTETREGYLDGFIIGEFGNATFSFHGFTK